MSPRECAITRIDLRIFGSKIGSYVGQAHQKSPIFLGALVNLTINVQSCKFSKKIYLSETIQNDLKREKKQKQFFFFGSHLVIFCF